jgi:hypothetical protein
VPSDSLGQFGGKSFIFISVKRMPLKMKIVLTILCWGFGLQLVMSQPLQEEVRSTTVESIKLFRKADQLSYPVIKLGQAEALELHFDDLQNASRNYYYSYQLCNADWTPANLSYMDYVRGFSQMRINTFRFASATQNRYVHYQVNLPQTNAMPVRSGNYLLKVFENADTSKLIFSKRLLIVEDKSTIAIQVQQPFSQQYFLTHQKIVSNIGFKQIDILNPAQEVKLVVLQNFRWDNARTGATPTFIRGKTFEYSAEDNFVFEGGKEWRWLDLRSLRLQSDRVASVDYNSVPNNVFLRPDTPRSPLRYIYFNDLNGQYTVDNLEQVNPWWQGDYGNVHFTFTPQNPAMFDGQQIYLFGELTNWQLNDRNRLQWNETLKSFVVSKRLKTGYYSYSYVTIAPSGPYAGALFRLTEGNMWQSENRYSVLVYYRPFGARSDELIGYSEASSLLFLNPQNNR